MKKSVEIFERNWSPIGVFDSGVGGVSVLKALQSALPNESFIYAADSANAPYGDKSKAFIEARTSAMASFLARANAKAIVIACNTATVVAVKTPSGSLPDPRYCHGTGDQTCRADFPVRRGRCSCNGKNTGKPGARKSVSPLWKIRKNPAPALSRFGRAG